MRAAPASDMTVFTSAKSTLIMPGTVMMSETPWTPCRRTSSAMRKASRRVAFFSVMPSILSFGMTMMVSTLSRRLSTPSSATRDRRGPSKANGLVTTPTVSALISLAISAITGAAPVPVPPPMPAVTKTMSAPSSVFLISCLLSSAAMRPISGSPPQPRPLQMPSPNWRCSSAADMSST